MKKVLAGMLSTVMLCMALAGCGGQQAASDANVDDLAYIQENGTLKIGITLFQPMNYYDENEPDKLVGFDTELAEAVCEKLGVTPEFIEIDWDQKVIELQSKNIDCIWNGMTILDELKENIDFSMPYSGNMQVCVVRAEDAGTYQSTEDMVGANIAVEAESAGQKAVEADENLSQAEMVAVGAQSDTLMEVAAGTSDVAVIDAVMAYASVGEGTSYSDLVVVDGIELGKEEYGIGFRKGSNLVEAVNTALQELTDEGVLDELQQKYPSVLVTLEKCA